MRKFSLARMVGGITFKPGQDITVPKQKLIKAFKSIGINAYGLKFMAHGSLHVQINWGMEDADNAVIRVFNKPL